MFVHVSDTQQVGETESILFEMLQQGRTQAAVLLTNVGINTMNYRFQKPDANGETFCDLDVIGTPTNGTLQSCETKVVCIDLSCSKIRLVGNASGGAILEFAVTRHYKRDSGGPLPILSL